MAEKETACNRYERLATEFERETGMTAPGKDVPAAIARDDFEERSLAWKRWLATRTEGRADV